MEKEGNIIMKRLCEVVASMKNSNFGFQCFTHHSCKLMSKYIIISKASEKKLYNNENSLKRMKNVMVKDKN
jgi:hypothetical protein